jgi:hypothetical protein
MECLQLANFLSQVFYLKLSLRALPREWSTVRCSPLE